MLGGIVSFEKHGVVAGAQCGARGNGVVWRGVRGTMWCEVRRSPVEPF